MPSSAVKHRGPAQVHALDNDVILLRQVDFKRLGGGLVEDLRRTDLRPGEKEGDMPWFLDGFVSADQPRDLMMSEALLRATVGYALARTDTGEILAQFERDQYGKASEVAAKAKPELMVNVLLEEEEADA
jgi:hypothetical protein